MKKENKQRSLSEIAVDIEKATMEYKQAKEDASMASTHEMSARNRLNTLQKEMDAAVNAMKEAAPWDSDWKSRERNAHMIPES